jgi:hypothetical protein
MRKRHIIFISHRRYKILKKELFIEYVNSEELPEIIMELTKIGFKCRLMLNMRYITEDLIKSIKRSYHGIEYSKFKGCDSQQSINEISGREYGT